MKRRSTVLFSVSLVLVAASFGFAAADGPAAKTTVIKGLASMPLAFTENQGQWDEQVLFRANAGGATMWFTKTGAYYQFTRRISKANGGENPPQGVGHPDLVGRNPSGFDNSTDSIETMMIKASFVGVNPNPRMVGEELLEYKCNYFIGNDPDKWRTDVPNYEAITYEEIYPGIDLKYYGNGKQMEYDFIVSPGVDPSQIEVKYEGAKSVSVNAAGELVIETDWGEVVEQRPVVYQMSGGDRVALVGEYVLKGDKAFGFELPDGYNADLPLVIDPTLVYSTYLGGNDIDYGLGIAVDASGAAYVTGWTYSTDFPTQNPYQTDQGDRDVFVTKLSSSGSSLVYSTYLGGSDWDLGYGIAVDGSGCAFVTGRTYSSDFPTQNAFDLSFNGIFDVFVTEITAAGNALAYSTFLGGWSEDWVDDIAVDGSGCAYVTGNTYSSDFPTQDAYDASFNGGNWDAFVTKFTAAGNELVFSTFLGGSSDDGGAGIVVDGSGCAYVTGWTASSNFPTQNAYDASLNGSYDVFVTKFTVAGDALTYSTFLGGSDWDYIRGIAVDGSGCAYVTGYTESTNFPTQNAYDASFNGGTYDVFVTKFTAAGNALVYSTFLGGSDWDLGYGIAVDGSGCAYVTGFTYSTDFPTENPYQTDQGSSDVFVTKHSSSGSSLVYSTYLGGSGNDGGSGIAVDASGAAYVTGHTLSTDFPTENPYQTDQGGTDAFVTKLSEEGNQPFEFVHITDIHVGVAGAAARFAQMVDGINALDPAPAFVVMTGDLVDSGCGQHGANNFQWFINIADELDMDYYTCPGNHESYGWPDCIYSTDNYETYINGALDWQGSRDGINLISLYSGHDWSWWDCFTLDHWDYHDPTAEGSGLSDNQVSDLESWLVSSPDMPAVVFMHHPIASDRDEYNCADEVDDPGSNGCISQNRHTVWDMLKDPDGDGDGADAVKLVLVGHHHRSRVFKSDDKHNPNQPPYDVSNCIETRNHTDNLPLHVQTDDAKENMSYRVIEVDGDNFKVFMHKNFKSTTNYGFKVSLTYIKKSLSDDSTLYPAVRLHAFDSLGNHVGPNDTGGIDLEITGALYDQDSFFDTLSGQAFIDGELISLYVSEDEYRYEFEAVAECTLSVEGELSRQDGTGSIFYYDSIALIDGSRVTAFVTGETIDPLLYMDYDGDGTPELQVQPDSVVVYGFVCGDVDGSGGNPNVADLTYFVDYLFFDGPPPPIMEAANVDGEGGINVGDLTYLVEYLFFDGPAPICAPIE